MTHMSLRQSNDHFEEEFINRLKNEFICRYNIDSDLACEMAVDLYDVLSLSDSGLENFNSCFQL